MKILEKIKKMLKKEVKFSTPVKVSFASPVVSSGKLTVKNNVIEGYLVCSKGYAKGHELYLDSEFLKSVVALGNANPSGVPAHFGHPESDTEALKSIIGYSKNFRLDGDSVRADLFLLNSAEQKPFIEELADKMPSHFGASMMFMRDVTAEISFIKNAGGKAEIVSIGEMKQVATSSFKSPDSNNTCNYPHVRLAELSSCDVVHTPAATNSFFSAPTLTEKLNLLKALSNDPEVMSSLNSDTGKEETKMSDAKTNDLERYKALKAEFSANPEFLLAQFEKGNSVEQAKAEFKDIKIKELEKELSEMKAKLSAGAVPPAHVSEEQSKINMLDEAKALVKAGKFSNLKAACSHLSRNSGK